VLLLCKTTSYHAGYEMKHTRLLLFATLALSSFVHASSPQLGIVEAATKAQDCLQSLALGPDFYIRSLSLQAGTDTNPEQVYVARFEPPKLLQLDAEGKPIVEKIKVIVVDMAGKASVEERDNTSRREIRRRIIGGDPSTNKP